MSGIKIPDFIKNSESVDSSFPRIINENSNFACAQPMRITIRERLGKGGYGTVYRCINDKDEEYAVKVISTKDEGIPCLMEASVMATYRHPGLNSSKIIMANSSSLYILQELAFSDLSKWRSKFYPSDEQIMNILHVLLSACSFLHREGLIHGDLKATNVLVYKDGSVKISDFTLTTYQNLKSINEKAKTFCTVTHRPLEVWRKQEIDEKVDIWSLGCTLFELKFGYSLFPYQGQDDTRDKSINALLDWHESGFGGVLKPDIQRNSNLHKIPELPADWDSNKNINRLILRMLKIHPSERPSADELLKDDYFANFLPRYEDKMVYSLTDKAIRTSISSKVEQMFEQWSTQEVVRNLAREIFIRTGSNKSSIDNGSSESTRGATCIWMAYKLVNNSTIRTEIFKVPLHIIVQTEREICNELGFMVHRLSSESKKFIPNPTPLHHIRKTLVDNFPNGKVTLPPIENMNLNSTSG